MSLSLPVVPAIHRDGTCVDGLLGPLPSPPSSLPTASDIAWSLSEMYWPVHSVSLCLPVLPAVHRDGACVDGLLGPLPLHLVGRLQQALPGNGLDVAEELAVLAAAPRREDGELHQVAVVTSGHKGQDLRSDWWQMIVYSTGGIGYY